MALVIGSGITLGSGISFNPPIVPTTLSVEYLVVAGGGGGTGGKIIVGCLGGGGGAGGYRTATGFMVSTGTPIAVTVGAGGTTASGARLGGESAFDTIISLGGEGNPNNTDYGGAGSGAGGDPTLRPTAVSAIEGWGRPGTPGQGHDGGNAGGVNAGASSASAGGGGGGAGGNGGNGRQISGHWHGGEGGIGLQSSISGTATYYAGGGGGSTTSSNTAPGGSGIGGPGMSVAGTTNYNARLNRIVELSAVINTGSGGGGASGGWTHGGNGGSGIVIIRYADSNPAASATTGSPTITVAGGYRVYKFTSSGSITF
jgi:hypothetical protein